jgi:hypothetical protein
MGLKPLCFECSTLESIERPGFQSAKDKRTKSHQTTITKAPDRWPNYPIRPFDAADRLGDDRDVPLQIHEQTTMAGINSMAQSGVE